MEWLGDYLGDLGPEGAVLVPQNWSDSEHWQIRDGWILITENSSLTREMVFQPRRQAVVVYGTLLTAWSVLCNLLLAVLVARKPHTDYIYPLKWLVLNSTAAQLMLAAFVVPLQVKTEHSGGWAFGPGLCRGWLFAQVG